MKINPGWTFATLAALAAGLLFQPPVTRADNLGHRDAQVTFTKWVTTMPGLPGLIANMEGVVGGDVGEGKFAGEVLKWDTSRDIIEIVAFYHLTGSKHSFSAIVHVLQPKTSSQGVIMGVVTEGWLKGRAMKGSYTQFDVGPNPQGATLPIPYFVATLNIEQDPAAAEPVIYATAGAGGSLVRIDVGARSVTEVGKTGVPFALGIAINAQGQAFTVTDSHPAFPGTPRLARVDLATGAATPFGPVLGEEEFMGLGFAPDGTLYGVNASSGTADAGSLYRFNPDTGEATKVGVTGGCFEIMDLAWHPDGTMYGAVNDSLYRVNPATGQATLVTKLQGLSVVMGLAIDDHGNFYVSEIVTNAPLLRVDPVTGATTRLFDTGVDFIHGLAIRPPPKPILYATADAGGSLVRIDVDARTVTEVGKTGVPFALGIAINAQGQAFTVTDSHPAFPGTPRLARVDLATGAATPFGPVLGEEEFMGLGFAPDGTLYGVNASSGTPDAGSLYRFNPDTGEATKVGVTGGCFKIMDLAWAPDGTMYGAVNDSLYEVNPATGQATLVTKLQGLSSVMGLAIDDHGNFYVSEIVTNAPLVRVDPVTGATTKLFDTGVDFVHGLALAPVPRLTAARVGDQLTLSWPAWTTGFDLQSAEAVAGSPSPAWAKWPAAPAVVGNRHTLAAETAGPARFFRLIRH